MPALPPEDRLWRHPSEVAQAARLQPQPDRRIRSNSTAIMLVAGMISVTLVAATFALLTAGTTGDTVEVAAAQSPWLGIQGVEVDDEGCEVLGIPGGVSVVSTATGGPAQSAGLRPGDVVTSVAGTEVHTMTALRRQLARHEAGEEVVVEIHRDGAERRVTVELRSRG